MEIKQLTLLTNNLAETRRFYTKTIGLKTMGESESSISFLAGTSVLRFELTDANEHPTYHFAFNIPSNKLNEALTWVRSRTSLIDIEGSCIANFDSWNAKAIYFFDNNANVLEFISRDDLNNPSASPFTVDSLLSLSEIGVVTDEPIKLAEQIIAEMRTEFFARGPKAKDFVAVGTDSGLFVISNPDRNWYPSDQRAEKWKVRGKIASDQGEFEFEYN